MDSLPHRPGRVLTLLALVTLVGLTLAVAAAPAWADVPLAEAGECAQSAPNTSLVRPVVYAPGGPVVGDPTLLLGAAVSAPPGGPLIASPQTMGFPGTGSCDKPGSGCMGPILPGPARPSGGTPVGGGGGGRIRESGGRPVPPPGLP